MTTDIFTQAAHEDAAALHLTQSFLFAISRGDPDWDTRWGSGDEPVPDLATGSVVDVIGYARPAVAGFLTPDEDGIIVSDTETAYSSTNDVTRFAQVQLSVPAGAFTGQIVREIGLYSAPTIAAGVPAGKTVLSLAEVQNAGKLHRLAWFRPKYFSAGTALQRHFILRF